MNQITGIELSGSDRLSLAGVQDGDPFYTPDRTGIQQPPLYGCPSAKQVKGLVPDCMLTEFEGLEVEQL